MLTTDKRRILAVLTYDQSDAIVSDKLVLLQRDTKVGEELPLGGKTVSWPKMPEVIEA